MTDSELDSILRKARVPEPAPEFWETLPRLAVARAKAASIAPIQNAQSPWFGKWAWAVAASAAVVIALVAIRRGGGEKGPADLLASPKMVREMLALFPSRLRAIVQDKTGMRLVLSEEENVPDSPPLYVRICDGRQCASVVTFSGQEIQVAGRDLTVLSDVHGGIILESKDLLWSSTQPLLADKHLRIEAKNLGPTPL